MCQLCRSNPCDPRCPNSEPKVVHYCDVCGGEIYEGDDYYDIHEERWCSECVESCLSTAEVE